MGWETNVCSVYLGYITLHERRLAWTYFTALSFYGINVFVREIVLKLVTNWQSDKGFLFTSKFRSQRVVRPRRGLCTCKKHACVHYYF